MTDQELLAAYRVERSADAMAELVGRHAAMVRATAIREVGEAAADDVMQAVFLVLLQRAEKSGEASRFSGSMAGWLFQTTLYAAANARRRATARQRHEREASHMEITNENPSELESAEIRGALNDAIERLPRADRDVVVMRYLEGQPTAAVAVALRVNEATARQRLSRALERLRNMLAKRKLFVAAGTLLALFETISSRSVSAAAAQKLQAVATGQIPASDESQAIAQGVQKMVRNQRILRYSTALAVAASVVLACLPWALSDGQVHAAVPAAGGGGASVPVPAPVVAQVTPGRAVAAPTSAITPAPTAAPPVTPEGAAALPKLVAANNQFALDFLNNVDSADGNVFYSPYSMSAALAMTWAGARGNTRAQMGQVLHLAELNEKDVTPSFGALHAAIAKTQDDTKSKLTVANSMWPDLNPEHKFLKEFVGIVENDFASSVLPVDFQHAHDASRKQINAWVLDKTNGKIKDILQPPDISELTRFVLVNTIYFKGRWANPFDAVADRLAPFHDASGKDTQVIMMNQTIPGADYADESTAAVPFQMLSVNYFGDPDQQQASFGRRPPSGQGLSFVMLVPKAADGLPALQKQLTPKALTDYLANLKPQTVNVFIPKFRVEERYSMAKMLGKMGMPDAFKSATADFSGMNGYKDLFIGAVIHQAFVEVNEMGTEAAAATAVAGIAGGRGPTQPPPVFRADRPFLFIIRENTTGAILFLGTLTKPKAATQADLPAQAPARRGRQRS